MSLFHVRQYLTFVYRYRYFLRMGKADVTIYFFKAQFLFENNRFLCAHTFFAMTGFFACIQLDGAGFFGWQYIKVYIGKRLTGQANTRGSNSLAVKVIFSDFRNIEKIVHRMA